MERVTNEELAKRIKDGEAVRENYTILWNNNIRLIRKIVSELTGLAYYEDSFQDMEQQAFIGLMEAVQSFDESKGFKFFSHAKTYIKKSLYRYYGNGGYSIRIPSYMKTRIRTYTTARNNFIEQNNRKPDDEEMRAIVGLSPAAYRAMMKAIQSYEVKSLDEYLKADDKESGSILDMIQSNDDVERSGIESVYLQELHEILFKALESVSDTGREIIMAHYFQGHSLSHISSIRGCTTQNVINHMKRAHGGIRKGKYGNELVTFLPERAAGRAMNKMVRELEEVEISEEERELMAW